MNKFLISFDAARATPASGLPDRALDSQDYPLKGDTLTEACSSHFSATARQFIPGIAIKPGQAHGDLEVIFPGGRDKVNTLKSIPGPFTMQPL